MNSKNFDENNTIVIFIILFQFPEVSGINDKAILRIILDFFKAHCTCIDHQYIIYENITKGLKLPQSIDMSCSIDPLDNNMKRDLMINSRKGVWSKINTQMKIITEKNFMIVERDDGKLVTAPLKVRLKYMKKYDIVTIELDHRNYILYAKKDFVFHRRKNKYPKWYPYYLREKTFPISNHSIVITKNYEDKRWVDLNNWIFS